MTLTMDSEWLKILKATHEATPLGFQPTTLPPLTIEKECPSFQDTIPEVFMHASEISQMRAGGILSTTNIHPQTSHILTLIDIDDRLYNRDSHFKRTVVPNKRPDELAEPVREKR